ncbi:MAG: hypothetical protein AAGK00_17650 [Pseudomonadota bacterium]
MFHPRLSAAALLTALSISGCAEPDRTQIDNPLTTEQRALYFIDTVETTVASDATINWETAYPRLAEEAGLNSEDPLVVARFADSPAGKAALRALVTDGLQSVLAPRLKDALGKGSKPAFLAFQLQALRVVSPGQQIVVGGGLHGIAGAVQIYDGMTGEKLSWAQLLAVGIPAGSGIVGVMADQQAGPANTRLLTGFAPHLKGWVGASHPIILYGEKTPVPDLPAPRGI